jgi:hypothetical protein
MSIGASLVPSGALPFCKFVTVVLQAFDIVQKTWYTYIDVHDEEKEIVMNDPKLRAFIEKHAEGTGLSPEEYYDHFDAMLKEHPKILDEILEKGLRDQRKRFENEKLEASSNRCLFYKLHLHASRYCSFSSEY